MKIKKASILTFVVVAALFIYGTTSIASIQSKIISANKTKSDLQMQVSVLQEENSSYRFAIDNSDAPDTMEDIARKKLGLVMPDEIIFYDEN